MAEVEKSLVEVLSGYMDQAVEVVKDYGPAVWDSTLALLRIQAVTEVVVWFFITGGLVWLARKWPKWIKDSEDEGSVLNISKAIVGGFSLVIFGTAQIVTLLCNVLEWTLGIVDPRLLLLYRVAHNAGLM